MDLTRYDFDRVIDRRNTQSRKWEFMRDFSPLADEDTLPFWIADMDFAAPQPVVEALKRRAAHGIFGYSAFSPSFYDALCGYYQRRHDYQIDRQTICYSPGLVAALGYLACLLTQPGEGIIIQEPVYYPFREVVLNTGRRLVSNSLIKGAGNDYRIDFDDLAEKVKQSKLLIFCHPHNPVGRVWSERELIRLGEICLANGVTILSDELHCDLLRRGEKHIMLEKLFPQARERIVTMLAPSKTFNLAGLQYSAIIIHDEELRRRWASYVRNICGIRGPHPLTMAAVEAAYRDGEPWLEQLLDYLDDNFRLLDRFLRERLPRAVYRIPAGTYLAWVDLSAYGFGAALFDRCIAEGKVLMEDGVAFGPQGQGFMRINAACPRPVLAEGLNRMASVIAPE